MFSAQNRFMNQKSCYTIQGICYIIQTSKEGQKGTGGCLLFS